jgi:hypothetical protein
MTTETVRVASDLAYIRTKRLSNTRPERYRCANLLGLIRYTACQFFTVVVLKFYVMNF